MTRMPRDPEPTPSPPRDVEVSDPRDVPAGDFSSWLGRTRDNLLTQLGASVPCGACTACCRSSQFVHIEPDETRTLERIPPALLFPAPGRPEGTKLLGYDQHGHCPMLVDNQCSIYEDRPRTCRNYDCRVFAATGLGPSEDAQGLISGQVGRWRFDNPTPQDRAEHAAVQAAGQFLRDHAGDFPGGMPSHPAQLALLAIKVYKIFLRKTDPNRPESKMSAAEMVASIIAETRAFQAARATASMGSTV
jgi:hypothetical protein